MWKEREHSFIMILTKANACPPFPPFSQMVVDRECKELLLNLSIFHYFLLKIILCQSDMFWDGTFFPLSLVFFVCFFKAKRQRKRQMERVKIHWFNTQVPQKFFGQAKCWNQEAGMQPRSHMQVSGASSFASSLSSRICISRHLELELDQLLYPEILI